MEPLTSQPAQNQDGHSSQAQSLGASRKYFTPYLDGLHNCPDTQAIVVYNQRIDRLSGAMNTVLQDFNTALWIDDKIGTEFILNGKQRDGIRRIIREVLLNDMYMGDIPKELQETYGVEESAAKEIARRIVFQLFTPAIDEIKRAQKEKYPHRINPGSPPPIAPSESAKTPEQEKTLEAFEQGQQLGTFGDTIDLRKR